MASDGETTAVAKSTGDDEQEQAETAEPADPETEPAAPAAEAPVTGDDQVVEGAVADGTASAKGARSRRGLVALGAAAVVLAVAVAVVGVLFARERAAHEDTRRALRAESARAAQLDRDLTAVRAERADLEKKLTAAEAHVLSPEAKLAIANCVRAYATAERVLEEARSRGASSGSVTFITPGAGLGTDSVAKLCSAAEPYLAKLD